MGELFNLEETVALCDLATTHFEGTVADNEPA